MGVAEPREEWDRLRLGSDPGCKRKRGAAFCRCIGGPNYDLAEEFLENYFLTEQGLRAGDHAKPIGVPALIALCETMAKDSALLRELKAGVDQGQIMPNIPQMGSFFSALGTALETATDGHASPEAAAREAEAIMRHGLGE